MFDPTHLIEFHVSAAREAQRRHQEIRMAAEARIYVAVSTAVDALVG